MTLTTDPRPAPGNAARGGRVGRPLMLYIQTRLRCRFARRLKPADYPRLAGMDFDRIAHALTETTYGEEARNLSLQLSGERLIRAMVHEELDFEARAVRRICTASPAATAWLDAFAWKYDLMALRQALRARATQSEFTDSLFAPLMNQPSGVYERLAAGAPFTEDDPAFAGLSRSPFTATLTLACGAHPPSPDEIETAILHDYYHGLIRALTAVGCRTPAAQGQVADEMHFVNLLTLLAARLSGTTVEQLTASLIPQGPWRSAETVRTLAAAPDVPRLVETLRHIPDAGLLRRLRLPASGPATVEMLETAARRALISAGIHALRAPGASLTAMSGYLLALEGEARDLCAIAAGLAGGLTQAEIIPLLTMTVQP